MNTEHRHAAPKKVLNLVLFLLIMGLTFYTIFHGQNWSQIGNALRSLSVPYLLLAVMCALFFVSAEGAMIWYLFHTIKGKKSRILRCISYSFIGFFYSGITPSATGGQPVQLYYMKKDGHSLSESSAVLMTVAILYKFVLVVIGGALLVFWHCPLREYLGGYYVLYLAGLSLNVIVVAALAAVMLLPDKMLSLITGCERLLIGIGILRPSDGRREKIEGFVAGYRETVRFLVEKKERLVLMTAGTFLQRISVFLLTALVYLGFSQHGTDILTVMLLQASVYVAVDMLPLPGAQGITELMYCKVFGDVFGTAYLMPSLYVTRGINFYFLLIVSLGVVAVNMIRRRSGIGRDIV